MMVQRPGGRRWPARESGQIAGIGVVVPGEDDTTPLWRLRNGMYVPATDTTILLQHELRQLDAAHFALMVAGMSATRLMDHERVNSTVAKVGHPAAILRHFQLALLLHLLFADAARTDWGGAKADMNDLADLCLMSGYVRAQADIRASDELEVAAMAYRTFYQQYWDFRDLTAWSRGLHVFRLASRAQEPRDRPFDPNAEFSKLYGVSLDEFLFLGFGLFAAATQQPGRTFDASTFKNFRIERGIAEAFVRLVSNDFDGLRVQHTEWIHQGINPPGFEPYHLNPLRRWPAIALDGGRIAVPIPRFLLDRITTGVYFDFMESLSEKGRSEFGDFWGRGFEQYVGELMRSQRGFDNLFPEMSYELDGRSEVTCDWIVRDRDTALLIECKTRGLNPKARVTCLKEHIVASVSRPDSSNPESSLAGGLAKLFKVRDAVLKQAPGLERLQGVTRVICLLVTLDPVTEGNQNYFRRILEEKAAQFGYISGTDWQMADIDGFERFCALVHASGESAVALLTEKLASPDAMVHDFLDYFVKRAPNLRVMDHPLHREGRDPFEALVRRYADHGGPEDLQSDG